ncbi:unnamed protein product [Symbiodinium microadriaticum]|nr:unnamed protein product [Symbiodinium microadriaticum]
MQMIRGNAELCSVCESALQAAGVDLEKAYMSEQPARKKQRKGDQQGEDMLPRCETRFGDLNVKVLVEMLCSMENIFTLHALNALKEGPKRAMPKDKVLQVIEFLTDVGAGDYIGTEGPLKNVDSLKKILSELNNVNGHRGQSLRLPPDWSQSGIYEVTWAGDSLTIRHKFLAKEACRKLPEDQQKLIKEGGLLRYTVASLFKDVVSDNPLENAAAVYVKAAERIPSNNPALLDARETPSSKKPVAVETPVKVPFSVARLGSRTALLGATKRDVGGDSPTDSSKPLLKAKGASASPSPVSSEKPVGRSGSSADLTDAEGFEGENLDVKFAQAAEEGEHKIRSELDLEIPSPVESE